MHRFDYFLHDYVSCFDVPYEICMGLSRFCIIGFHCPIDSIASSKDSVNSLRGLIAYGIPGLLYFILGTARSERGRQSNIE